MLIVGAVVVAVVVSAAGDESRAEIEYLESLRSQVSELARDGEALRDVAGRLGDTERVEFETVIETLREDLSVARAFVEAEPPSPALAAIRSLYRVALSSWSAGVDELAAALLAAADDPDSVLVLDRVANAISDLRAGDAVYEALVAEIVREDSPAPLSEMPTVKLNPRTGPLGTISAILVSAARSQDGGLGLRPGLAVSQIVAEPEWEVNPSGQAVVPSTELITFSVVITNLGNVVSEMGTVVLILSSESETVELEAEFEALDPNEQVTVIFQALEVSPGGVYLVDASLAPTNQDSDLTDNQVQVQFTVNE